MKSDNNQFHSIIKKLLFSIVCAFLPLMICSGRISAFEITWKDYREPIRNIRVCHNETAKIFVNLPEEFLINNDEIKLSVTIESRTTTTNYAHFYAVNPSLKINNVFFQGNYIVPVDRSKNNQTHIISIKRKDFNAGENVIKASFRLDSGYSCGGTCCAFIINKMYFVNAPKKSTRIKDYIKSIK